MSPNGRRAWRKWVRRQDLRRKHKQPKGSVCRMARQARRHIPLVPGAVLPKLLTARSLVGMSMGARKRAWEMMGYLRSELRIGKRLRPCLGCPKCEHGKCWRCDNCGTTKGLCDLILAEVRCKCGKGCGKWRISFPAATVCDGSGVLPAKHQLCLGCSWCGTPPKEGATRFTDCDGSGVMPARQTAKSYEDDAPLQALRDWSHR